MKNKAILILVVISVVVYLISQIFAAIIYLKVPIAISFSTIIFLCLLFKTYEYLYFESKKFHSIKNGIKQYTTNCNELNNHIKDLKKAYVNIKSYDFGDSSIHDVSNYNFTRAKWSVDTKSRYIHNCSATVCKNASNQPFKYLCKYFDINKTEDSLMRFESILNDFAAAEQGKHLLKNERDLVLGSIMDSIPWLIKSLSKKKLVEKLGFEEIDMSDLYFPVYTFSYVSAGGNSSLKCNIKLDVDNLDRFIIYLRDLITFRKSIKGQRALMTSSLREKIKKRDNYTCQNCSLSIYDERNLLLEIDHITPLSRGGDSTESNLQTLCWRCNRSKGSKILTNNFDLHNNPPHDNEFC